MKLCLIFKLYLHAKSYCVALKLKIKGFAEWVNALISNKDQSLMTCHKLITNNEWDFPKSMTSKISNIMQTMAIMGHTEIGRNTVAVLWG